MKNLNNNRKPAFGLSYDFNQKPINIQENYTRNHSQGGIYSGLQKNNHQSGGNLCNYSSENYGSKDYSNNAHLSFNQAYLTNKKVTDRLTKPTTASLNHRSSKIRGNIIISSLKNNILTDRTNNLLQQSNRPTSTSSSSFNSGYTRPQSQAISSSNSNKCIPNKLLFKPESVQRQWLIKHGKEKFVDFTSEELLKLRKYFQELDEDGSGSIGLEELEKPLISLGLCKSRAEVQKIIEEVDEDESGQIEFNEFLNILKGVGGSKQGKAKPSFQQSEMKSQLPPLQKQNKQKNKENIVSAYQSVCSSSNIAQNVTSEVNAQTQKQQDEQKTIYKFFKNLTNGKLKSQENSNIPFQLFVSNFRRRRILNAMFQGKNKGGFDNDKKQLLKIYERFLLSQDQPINILEVEESDDDDFEQPALDDDEDRAKIDQNIKYWEELIKEKKFQDLRK